MSELSVEEQVSLQLDTLAGLKKLAGDVNSGHAAIEKARTDAAKEEGDAGQVVTQQLQQLQTQLPPTDPDFITGVITSVDAGVTAAEGAEKTARDAVAAAQKTLDQTRAGLAASDSALKDAQANLGKLPADIKAAQDKVAKLRAAAVKAFNAATTIPPDRTQLRLAYFLTVDLQTALAALQALTSPNEEGARLTAVTEAWKTQSKKKQDVADAQAALDDAQTALTGATGVLKDLRTQRDTDIQKRLAHP